MLASIMGKTIIPVIVFLSVQILQGKSLTIIIDTVRVGDYAHGGIVFLIDNSGQHGLVCALTDQIRGIYWYEAIIDTRNQEAAGENSDQKGKSAHDYLKKESPEENLAIKLCAEYSIWIDGVLFDDWYFPSKEEVHQMYENREEIDINALKNGGSLFTTNNELSPTEFCNSPSWEQEFNYGYQNYDYKKSKFNVRAIRAF